jgi:hypothetical protein
VNANSPICLGHEENNAATCPSGTADNFIYNYKVKAAGTLTSLHVDSSKAQTGSGATVSVLQNGTAVMSCTVVSGDTACEASGSVPIAVNDHLQVQVTNNTGAANNAAWKTYVTIG